MAFLISHFWPGATEEQYAATVAVIHPPDGLPAGQTIHAAGPTDGGYQVVAIWDSKESCDTFLGEMMGKMPIEGGVHGPPEEHTAEIAHFQTA